MWLKLLLPISSVDLATLLQRLGLEKYLSCFEEEEVGLSTMKLWSPPTIVAQSLDYNASTNRTTPGSKTDHYGCWNV